MAEQAHKTNYNEIFYWLLGLAALSVIGGVFRLSPVIVNTVIFSVAFIKACLVAWNFMHLKNEGKLVYVIALVPIVLFLILVALLLPDFIFPRNKPHVPVAAQTAPAQVPESK